MQLPARKPVHRDQLVTVGDLEAFKSELLFIIRNLLAELKGSTTKKWLKSYEVRKLLNISNGTLQTLRNNGTIPFTRIGGTLYYSSEDIDKLLLKRQENGIKPYGIARY